jgi:hypothetical protein
MTTRIFTRFALPIVAAAMLSLAPGAFAPSAFAQTMTMAPSSTMKPMAPAKPTAKPSMMAPASSYTSLADAQAKCAGDTVVWSTMSKSKSYHTSTSKYFGKTKKGGYMCEKAAAAAGYHAAKN